VCHSYQRWTCVPLIPEVDMCVTHTMGKYVCHSYHGWICMPLIPEVDMCATHIRGRYVCHSYQRWTCVSLISEVDMSATLAHSAQVFFTLYLNAATKQNKCVCRVCVSAVSAHRCLCVSAVSARRCSCTACARWTCAP